MKIRPALTTAIHRSFQVQWHNTKYGWWELDESLIACEYPGVQCDIFTLISIIYSYIRSVYIYIYTIRYLCSIHFTTTSIILYSYYSVYYSVFCTFPIQSVRPLPEPA